MNLLLFLMRQLQTLSKHWDFKDGLNEGLADRFVYELLNEAIQRKILTEENLIFKHAVEIGLKLSYGKMQKTMSLYGKSY